MKKICMFFMFSVFIFNINIGKAIDVADKQFQLRLQARENFCKNTFQNYPGRDFIVVPKNSDTLYIYCMAEFYRSEEDYNTAITYYREVIKKDNNFIDAYLELADLYGVVGDIDFTILYLYSALDKLQELQKNNIKYLKNYIEVYKQYIEAYNAKGLNDIATAEKNKLLYELEELHKTSLEPFMKSDIKKYIDELRNF